ncbi:MAG: hypothetical protein J0G30_12420 [Actinomycetales bacterium]|nr:hypothetical protein [Actinomycetales bacterium]
MTGRTVLRLLMGAGFLFAGAGHLSFARREFQAQVPTWIPADPDLVVVASGGVELALGTALVAAPRRARPWVGGVIAAFLVAVFPGNFEQWADRRDGFGLDTDRRRLVRLFFQPVLIAAVLWATRVPKR